MNIRLLKCFVAVSMLTISLIAVVTAHGSGGDRSASPQVQSKTAGEVYGNVQVLKEIPASKLGGAMRFMTASLGVGCDYCHTDAFASDEKSPKQTARQMLLMTRDLNKQYFSGLDVVTCFTCHKGNTEPAAQPEISKGSIESSVDDELVKPERKLPTAEEVMSRYVTALGGEKAIDSLRTKLAHGFERVTAYGSSPSRAGIVDDRQQIDIFQAAPHELLSVVSSARVKWTYAVDGETGWETVGDSIRPLDGEELQDARREADFFRYLKIADSYPRMVVLKMVRINGREAYVIGASALDGEAAKLYFDAASGLLLRKAAAKRTVLGMLPDVTDFDDYRLVNGVKFPSKIVKYQPPVTTTVEFSKIEVNAPIDMGRFKAPKRP
ncbi:MAG: c-type cytochrome [Blastocatellia bacterium]